MTRPPRTLRGTGVSPGVAWAPAFIMRADFPNVPDRGVLPAQVDHEVDRLRAAADEVADELRVLGERVLKRAGPEESRIFDAQIMMVQDPIFLEGVESLIRSSHLSAETAYEFKALELRNAWSGVGSAHIRERLADLTATQLRMLHKLMDRDGEVFTVPSGEPVIVVAHELSPGLTVQLDREQVVGLISEEGTRTSHAAILAHSLGIPAVMGAMGALTTIPEGATVLMDGSSGMVTVEPTRDELEDARARLSRRHRLELQLESVLDQPAVSPDGRRITLLSNVDLPDELEAALRNGAEGVGLLRTEFLLTGRTALPTEDEQADYFRRVARAFAGKPVVIRSYDLGGDKFPAAFQTAPEANPFLGWRSIRVCLDQPDVFRAQLRALLRVAADADIRLMLPLVTSVDELLERLMDILLAFPQLILALAIASILGPAVQNVVIAVSIPIIPRAARVVRSAALAVKENQYVEAVNALGASWRRVVAQHILPNVAAPYIIMLTAQLGGAILAEAALSYLGLGAAEPTPSWGLMLSGSAPSYAEKAPWIALFPGIAISLGVFGFNLFGDSLRDALDPKLRGR